MINLKISIIIPVYNTEKYIRGTSDSILAQTYTDWECLLIDDGSKDSSGEICDEYAKNDSRFRVFHKANGGVSSARNVGLDNANGEWITFCDSDDQLEPDALEKYIKAVDYSNADIIRAGYKEVYSDGRSRTTQVEKSTLLIRKSEMLLFMESTRYFGFLWNSFCRKTVIKGLRFAESVSWCEDHLFSLQAYNNSRSVYYIPDIVYCYFKQPGCSLSYPSNPYMIIEVANLEYAAKQKLIENCNQAQLETVQIYQSKVGKALTIAIDNMEYSAIKEYYKRTKQMVMLYGKPNKSKILDFFYKSNLPCSVRIVLVRLFYKIMNKK